VVIPVFNRQRLGERALASACAQTIDGMEIIVVDDGSDPPFRIPAETALAANVHLIRHDVNSGSSAARNSGITAACGEWIALLDSDDYWPPDTLEPRLNYARQASRSAGSAPIAYAAGFIIRKGAGADQMRIPREASGPEEFVCGCWFAPGSTILFRKEVYERIGPWDPDLRRLEDYDWFLRFALAGGRLRVWDGVGAVTEVEGKPTFAMLEATARRLLWKYGHIKSPHALPGSMVRHLRALLDVERASISRYQRRWLRTFFYLARSFARVPRASIQLRRFWVVSVVSSGDAAAGMVTGRVASPPKIAWRTDRAW
jgi:glycosyltransferase involved in cell wall biosynthesis